MFNFLNKYIEITLYKIFKEYIKTLVSKRLMSKNIQYLFNFCQVVPRLFIREIYISLLSNARSLPSNTSLIA